MQIYQILTTIGSGDIIEKFALDIQFLLSQIAVSTIFVEKYVEGFDSKIESLDSLKSKLGSYQDLIIYHLTYPDDSIINFLFQRPEKLIIIYHGMNFSYGSKYSSCSLAELVKEQLKYLFARSCAVVADSYYNAQELSKLGYKDIEVIYPLSPWKEFLQSSYEPTSRHLQTVSQSSPVIVCPSHFIPLQRLDFLIQSFSLLVGNLLPNAELIIVGITKKSASQYHSVLQELVLQLGLKNVWLHPKASLEELAEFFRWADLFVFTSEYEGFPSYLIEAMASKKPILTRDYGVNSEILSSSGVVVPKDFSQEEYAEAMAILIQDKPLRNTIIKNQALRLQHFNLEQTRISLLELLFRVI